MSKEDNSNVNITEKVTTIAEEVVKVSVNKGISCGEAYDGLPLEVTNGVAKNIVLGKTGSIIRKNNAKARREKLKEDMRKEIRTELNNETEDNDDEEDGESESQSEIELSDGSRGVFKMNPPQTQVQERYGKAASNVMDNVILGEFEVIGEKIFMDTMRKAQFEGWKNLMGFQGGLGEFLVDAFDEFMRNRGVTIELTVRGKILNG